MNPLDYAFIPIPTELKNHFTFYFGGRKPHATRKGGGRSGNAPRIENPAGTKLLRAFKSKQGGLRHKRKIGW